MQGPGGGESPCPSHHFPGSGMTDSLAQVQAYNRPSSPWAPLLRAVPVCCLSAALWTCAGAAPLGAQTPGREPAVVEIVPGARALGLGMALQVASVDPEVAFVHPGLVQGLSGIQGSHTWFGGGGRSHSLAGAADWLGGGIAFSLHTLDYLGTPDGPGGRALGLDDFVSEPAGGEGVSETAATVTYGRTVKGLALGVSARAFGQRYGTDRTGGASLDVGAARRVGPVQMALSVRNLGGDADLPEEVVLGAGTYGRPVGPLDVGAAVQLRYRGDGTLEAGGGVEFGYWPVRGRTFVGRVGFRGVPEGDAQPVTVGGSFWGDSLVLDYAFQPMDGLDGIHRVSLGWR